MQKSILMNPVNQKKLTGSRKAVLELLADGYFHTSEEICRVGGTSGLRRLRELREMGYPIHGEPIPGSNMWQYRLNYIKPGADTEMHIPQYDCTGRLRFA
jgi:hypothetical protein